MYLYGGGSLILKVGGPDNWNLLYHKKQNAKPYMQSAYQLLPHRQLKTRKPYKQTNTPISKQTNNQTSKQKKWLQKGRR